jgi:hypothetical protein
MVVRPIVTYAATMMWPRVNLKISKIELDKLQRMVCLGITGTMKPLPTLAIEVLIQLSPLPLQLDAEAREGIYRFYYSDQRKPKSEGFGHVYMTQSMKKEPIIQMGTERMILRHGHVYDKFPQSDSLAE